MTVIVDNDPTYGKVEFGDSSGTLADRIRAGAQTIHELQGGFGALVGDADTLSERALGGDDDVLGQDPNAVTVIGDAFHMLDRAGGGDDLLSARATFSAKAIGDALSMIGRTVGGDDSITVTSDFAAIGYGDAVSMSDRAQGGDDHLGGVTPFHGTLELYGDAETMSGRARGGDDTIEGDDLSNTLVGDAKTLSDRAQGGDDLLIGKAQNPTFLPEINNMYGDGLTLSGRAQGGDDRLVSGQGAEDHMWGDAATVTGRAKGGADTFVFGADNGRDVVEDFQQGRDHIELHDTAFASFADLSGLIEQTAEGVLIRFDADNSILVKGVNQLNAGDFLFTGEGARPPVLKPVGQETLLETGALSPAAGVLENGNVALFFRSSADDHLHLQRFCPNGAAQGPLIDLGPLETPTGGAVGVAEVVGLHGGGYAVGWTEAFSHAVTSRYAVVDAQDKLVTEADFDLGGLASGLAATALGDGGFALLEARSGIVSTVADLLFQRFSAAGAPVGDPLVLAGQTDPAGGLFYRDPQAVAVDGGVELLWVARDGIHAGLVAADDTFSERLVIPGGAHDLDAARLTDGRVVATWAAPNGDAATVMAAVFDPSDPDADPLEITVADADVFDTDVRPEVTALPGGGWAISWHEGDPHGFTTARTFSPTGVGGAEFSANGDFLDSGGRPTVFALRVDDGDVFLSRYQACSMSGHAATSPALADLTHAASDWLI